MYLSLRTNYDTVMMAGRTVKLNEEYRNSTMVNRFAETVSHRDDESAFNYILSTDYQSTDPHVRNTYNHFAKDLNSLCRIYDSFAIESAVLGVNKGAGFCALVSEENYPKTLELISSMMNLLGLDDQYELISRYENQAVYAIIRK